VIVLSSAERLPLRLAAQVAAALERQALGLIALDGGLNDEEQCPRSLTTRLAMHIDLRAVARGQLSGSDFAAADIERGRARLAAVTMDDEALRAPR
jgi:magnesium chelatase subunit D